MDLKNKNISYILVTSDKLDDIVSVLYSSEYFLLEMSKYSNGKYHDTLLAYGDVSDDLLRKDTIFILNNLNVESLIVKYKNEDIPRLVHKSGSEKPLDFTMYCENSENSYVYKGLSFSFTEGVRYWKPKELGDFKKGMVIEYLNSDKWCEKVVDDVNTEWNNMYKLLIKYDKIRIKAT